MRSFSNRLFLFSLITVNALYAADNTAENELADLLSRPTELKAEVGSRSGSKNTLVSNTPVDVITYEQIEKSGLTSLVDVMRYFVAGFNAPEASSMTDGSDHIRAFTLRGMSPDQILVLVNGKRLHSSSLLHINGTIGRGSSNADLDTIAVKSVEKIEILRDGAAAQYGSDAIAGVVNIILKGLGHSNSVSLHEGQRGSGDGRTTQGDAFVSIPLKYDGFANFTLSLKDIEHTDNAGIDSRAGVNPPRVTTKMGIPDSKNYQAVTNIEAPLEDDTVIYANGLFNNRDSKANAFYRAPSAASMAMYPNGFLPIINAKITDYSAALGVRGGSNDMFEWDISNKYGHNEIDFFVNESMNYALANLSPTSFDNGGLSLVQNTTNLDLKKKIGNLDLAGGAEYRHEKYKITAGEEASYIGALNVDSGAQGLKGFRPESAVEASRDSYSLYIDTKYHINEDLSFDTAGRFENFSDFGQTKNIKFALGYKPIDDIFLRTSASTGFRAPSLAQSNYSFISSYTSGADLTMGGTFRPSADVSKAFGAKELKPETSKHFAVGAIYKPTANTSFSVDYFYALVNNKIMLSNSFTAVGATAAQVAVLNAAGVSSVNFFTNAVDTKTQGVDVKFDSKFEFNGGSKLNFGVWYNYNDNKVVGFNDDNFNRTNSFREIDKLENGQPKHSAKILNVYSFGNFDTTLNFNWFGPYKDVPPSSAVSYSFGSTWTTDMDIAYKFSKNILFALGGNNIFNTMPDKWDRSSNVSKIYASDGILPYSLYSPIGHSGAYYYVRAAIKF